MSIMSPAIDEDLVFPAFLTRSADEARGIATDQDADCQISACAGVAWAAFGLFWLAMYALARAVLCRLVLSGLVRVQGMRCASVLQYRVARASGYVVGFLAGGAMFF